MRARETIRRLSLVPDGFSLFGGATDVAQALDDKASDRNLIERLRAHDDEAVSEMAARYTSRIRQLALRHVRNEEDAEEVVQDVLFKVCRNIETFRGDSALSSWIYRITFNTAMSRLRTAKAARHEAELPLVAPAGSDGVRAPDIADWSSLGDDETLRSELRQKLVKALAGLPPLYRVPVLLRDVQGLSTQQASAALAVNGETLKSRLHRGRMILRDRLAEFSGGLALHRSGAWSSN
jgi:RNA polymerase sigma-70 factor (ECF subfamily)